MKQLLISIAIMLFATMIFSQDNSNEALNNLNHKSVVKTEKIPHELFRKLLDICTQSPLLMYYLKS